MSAIANPAELREYYRWHSRIYDLTRWSFLFGRGDLLQAASRSVFPDTILEIGCGTGRNLLELARLNPQARLMGIDLSPEMLAVARRKLHPLRQRVSLREGDYRAPMALDPAPNLIVISYCLSMINPGWERVIAAAKADLAPRGCLAVVDFHGSRWPVFRRWMRLNHVVMDRHLLPALQGAWPQHRIAKRHAFGGIWSYFRFLGFQRDSETRREGGGAVPLVA